MRVIRAVWFDRFDGIDIDSFRQVVFLFTKMRFDTNSVIYPLDEKVTVFMSYLYRGR